MKSNHVNGCFEDLEKSVGITALEHRWEKCVEINRYYIDKQMQIQSKSGRFLGSLHQMCIRDSEKKRKTDNLMENRN